jgi:hypothetical protein
MDVIKNVQDSVFGSFVDYLCRRLVAEAHGHDIVRDFRAEIMLSRGCDGLAPAYETYRNVGAARSEDILGDIFLTSLSHLREMGQFDAAMERAAEHMHRLLVDGHSLTDDDVASLRVAVASISADVLLNPRLDHGSMRADADVLHGPTLTDFKTSKKRFESKDYLPQFSYAALVGIVMPERPLVTRFQLLNLYLGYVTTCDISSWTEENRRRLVDVLLPRSDWRPPAPSAPPPPRPPAPSAPPPPPPPVPSEAQRRRRRRLERELSWGIRGP